MPSQNFSLQRLFSRLTRVRKRPANLAAVKARVEEAFGPWTAHNCQLADGLWTMRAGSVNFDEKTRRCVRIVQDFFGSRLSGLRILDLGAGEGALSLEFAAQGARVVCVEGRQMNLAKVEFAASALGLKIELRCQDVRHLRETERYDVVLCFGLLYHLDLQSAVRLLEKIGLMAERLLVLDTHFSLAASETISLNHRTFRGHLVREHEANATAEAKTQIPWASLDNNASFWLSKATLMNELGRAGFGTVYEVEFPLVFDYWDRQTEERMRYRDRATFVAAKSRSTPILTAPAVNAVEPREIPEDLEKQLFTWPPPPKAR